MQMPKSGMRASTVIIHTVQPADTERYLARQREIQVEAEKFPGYQRIDVYPPDDPQGTQWVVVLHFDTPASLEGWMISPIRLAWIKRVQAEGLEFQVTKLPHGFGAWLAGAAADGLPPQWKIALTVLLGLYPTVMMLTLLASPWTAPHLGLAGSLLVGNAISVCLMQWAVMPILTRVVGPWFKTQDRGRSLAGAGAIAAALVGLAFLFALSG